MSDDLSRVWILCDVYENDLGGIHAGQAVDLRLNAYPDKVFAGKVGSIGPILDPATRTAKVRVELQNPGLMRVGMFVAATFHLAGGAQGRASVTVPATAVLHLHDRDWVYTPAGSGGFRRISVVGGDMLPGGMQGIKSGLTPGQQVVANALTLQNAVDQ